jgi:uncharacterized protein YozE (UPF0346 family)
MRTFYEWLINQQYRNDEIGILARTLVLDQNSPKKKTKRILLAFIVGKHPTMIANYDFAWKEYKIYRDTI